MTTSRLPVAAAPIAWVSASRPKAKGRATTWREASATSSER